MWGPETGVLLFLPVLTLISETIGSSAKKQEHVGRGDV